MESIELKRCCECRLEKPKTTEFFWKNGSRLDGFHSSCKNCYSARRKHQYNTDEAFRKRRKQRYLTYTYGPDAIGIEKPQVCPICLKPENEVLDGMKRGFVLDHCHETGQIRGYICTHCNKGLGNFRDDIESLSRAIAYLKKEYGEQQ